jgi:hypothetical protein
MLDNDDTPARVYDLDDLAITTAPGEKPTMSPYGCWIMEDGTVHALTRQHTHGMILSLLFPDKAASVGYAPPDSDSSVFDYQRFDLDHRRGIPCVRIATGSLIGNFNINKSDAPATEAQLAAIATYARLWNVNLNDPVYLDVGVHSLRKALKMLALNDDAMARLAYAD